MALTDTEIRNTKAGERPRKLADGRGLYLLVTPSGGKLWRAKYRYQGKEKKGSYGRYPDVSLVSARKQHAETLSLLAEGVDPMAKKEAEKKETLRPSPGSGTSTGSLALPSVIQVKSGDGWRPMCFPASAYVRSRRSRPQS